MSKTYRKQIGNKKIKRQDNKKGRRHNVKQKLHDLVNSGECTNCDFEIPETWEG